MPQNATASKPNEEVQCLTKSKEDLISSHSAEKNAMQCVKRRLQYSQLPVRCQKRPYYRPGKSPFKLPGPTIPKINLLKTISGKSSPENSKFSPGSRIPVTPRCKKSLSMIDLSPIINDPEFAEFRSESSLSSNRREEMEDRKMEALCDGVISGVGNESGMWLSRFQRGRFDYQLEEEHRAAGIMCHVLVVNAWRKRREEVSQLQETIQQLNNQVDHLHIQIVVLRRLLETENDRVGRLNAEINHEKLLLSEVQQQKEILKLEKENLEREVQSLKDASEENTVAKENLKNQLISVQSQLEAVDAQISREREKLLKLREDKKILLEKVTASEALSTERGLRAEKAELEKEELKLKLVAQTSLVASMQENVLMFANELKIKEEETRKLEEQLKDSNKRATNLESHLSDREAALRRVESAYNSQISELNDLKERLLRQSQEGGWSSRVLQIAESVVRAPRALLRTLSFFSHSANQMV